MARTPGIAGVLLAAGLAAGFGKFQCGTPPPCTLAISPSTASVAPGATAVFQAFAVTPSGGSVALDPTAVQWSAFPGAIDPASGTFTAPASGAISTVTASLGSSCSATSVVTVGELACVPLPGGGGGGGTSGDGGFAADGGAGFDGGATGDGGPVGGGDGGVVGTGDGGVVGTGDGGIAADGGATFDGGGIADGGTGGGTGDGGAIADGGTSGGGGTDGGSCATCEPAVLEVPIPFAGSSLSVNTVVPAESGIPSLACDGSAGTGAPFAFSLSTASTSSSLLAVSARLGDGSATCGATDGGCVVQVRVRPVCEQPGGADACGEGTSSATLRLSRDAASPTFVVVDAFAPAGASAAGTPLGLSITNLVPCASSADCTASQSCSAGACCSAGWFPCGADAECCSGSCVAFRCAPAPGGP